MATLAAQAVVATPVCLLALAMPAVGQGVLRLGAPPVQGWITGSLLVLLLGSAAVLVREARRSAVGSATVVLMGGLWLFGLAVRLEVSPHAFLHEYYHVAETLSAYLGSGPALPYGETGPTLFRLAASLGGRPFDAEVIFLCNALVSSLAVPAVALLVVELTGDWPRALAGAALLAGLPQHLRFSASEDLFVQAVTFGIWALGLLALFLRRGGWLDGLLAAVAASVAMQTRPEMLLFPGVILSLAWLPLRAQAARLLTWPAIASLALALVLFAPRATAVLDGLQRGNTPTATMFEVRRYVRNLTLLDLEITPLAVLLVVVLGCLYDLWRRPAMLLWYGSAYIGLTAFSAALFDNPPYHLRSQVLANSLLVGIAGGGWIGWLAMVRMPAVLGGVVTFALAAATTLTWRPFVAELGDQALEWRFLERSVAVLPQPLVLLANLEPGGRELNKFPTSLLQAAGISHRGVDLPRALRGEAAWPEPGVATIFYQGMSCYFSFHGEPPPGAMRPLCQAVHDRYLTVPLQTAEIRARGSSWLQYSGDGRGPFRIGFYRLLALK